MSARLAYRPEEAIAGAGLLVGGDAGVEDSPLRAVAVRVRHAHSLLVCAR